MIFVDNPFGQDPFDFNDETAASRVGNRIRMIRTDCGSLFLYGCSAIDYSMGELEQMNKVIRNKLYEKGIYNRLCISDRLDLPLSELGYGLFNFRIEYGKKIIRIINKISVNATTDILKLQEIIKVKKEGKNLVSMFLRIMKNVISLEDIRATIT